ncbi:hypothetical protein TCAL_16410 [Tigriopus californicus]|uniref:FHA domain-containing protein n=1 Tax=Tigriopus californicus TaxID=6832 RepID=A0A553P047_TIGCA|nr:nibrin-like [Tigriopus californicus]TRY71064.1 hypothetical protein TCAL_16410 [Tigriopus californicus]
MWWLYNEKVPKQCVSLLPGLTYRVGRAQGHIICHKDASVSRNHALIQVLAGEAEGSGARPRVEIRDQGSKYGTYVGEAAIASTETSASSAGNSLSLDASSPKGPKTVSTTENVRIKFGFQTSIFMLKWTHLVCTGSSLNRTQKLELSQTLQYFPHAKFVTNWHRDVTHLVMNEVILTLKVVQALAKGTPIVTPLFFKDLKQCSISQQILPDVANYVPKLVEKTLNPANISCKVDPNRKTLFQGREFVFCTRAQMDRYQWAIHDAGGESVCASPTKVLDLQSDSVLVIKPMNEADMDRNPEFKTITETLKQLGRHSFPEQNIGIALLKSRVDLDLNPKKKPQLKLSQKLIDASQDQNKWASQTQSLRPPTQSMLTLTGRTSKVPETLTGDKSEVKLERGGQERMEDDDDDLFGPSTSFKRPPSPKATPNSKRVKIEQVWEPSPKPVNDEEEDLFGCTPLPSMEPQASEITLSDVSVSKKRRKESPKANQSPVKRSRLLHCPETGIEIRPKKGLQKEIVRTVHSHEQLHGSSDNEMPQEILSVHIKKKGVQVLPSTSTLSASSSSASKENSTIMSENGMFFKKKSKVLSETRQHESSINDISLGCSLITLKHLVRPEVPKPTFVPSNNSQELGRPVKNFKRFKKQGLASQMRRQFVSLNNTINQTRQPTHENSFTGNVGNHSSPNVRGQSEEDEDHDRISEEDEEVMQSEEGHGQSQEGEMWDF